MPSCSLITCNSSALRSIGWRQANPHWRDRSLETSLTYVAQLSSQICSQDYHFELLCLAMDGRINWHRGWSKFKDPRDKGHLVKDIGQPAIRLIKVLWNGVNRENRQPPSPVSPLLIAYAGCPTTTFCGGVTSFFVMLASFVSTTELAPFSS